MVIFLKTIKKTRFQRLLLTFYYFCLTIPLAFSDVRGITNRKHVEEGYEQVSQALLEYTVTCYPQIQVKIFISLLDFFPFFIRL